MKLGTLCQLYSLKVLTNYKCIRCSISPSQERCTLERVTAAGFQAKYRIDSHLLHCFLRCMTSRQFCGHETDQGYDDVLCRSIVFSIWWSFSDINSVMQRLSIKVCCILLSTMNCDLAEICILTLNASAQTGCDQFIVWVKLSRRISDVTLIGNDLAKSS